MEFYFWIGLSHPKLLYNDFLLTHLSVSKGRNILLKVSWTELNLIIKIKNVTI